MGLHDIVGWSWTLLEHALSLLASLWGPARTVVMVMMLQYRHCGTVANCAACS